MTTYIFTVSVGYSGATQEDEVTVEEMGYTDEEWNKLSEDQKLNALSDQWQDWMANFVDGGWELKV